MATRPNAMALLVDLGRSPASGPWLTAVGVGAGTAAVDAMDPAHRHVPLCPLHAVTGWWCPLCGGLRATQAVAHGNVAAALHDNAVLLASVPVLAWLWLDWLGRVRSDRSPPALPGAARIAVVAVLVAFTVLRNLPGAQAWHP